MSEQLKQSLLSHEALTYAAEHLHVSPENLSVEPVTGGFSLNRRAIVRAGDESLFVKQVDDSVLEGDGQVERAWLAKDHGVMNLLRSEGIGIVPEWSSLSPNSETLLMTAYPASEGWHWTLPNDQGIQGSYIQKVVEATRQLETATFDANDIERLSLQPYFRDKIGDIAAHDAFTGEPDILERLSSRYASLSKTVDAWLQPRIQQMESIIKDKAKLRMLGEGIVNLSQQPNEVFGHCDIRADNLAYSSSEDRLVIVDWNWASQTPRKFGSTEFLISVAAKGADVSSWYDELSPELLASLVGFWWRCCLQPNIGETSELRDHQAISAAIAYDLLTKVS